MGIINEFKKGYIDAREKSIIIQSDILCVDEACNSIEVNYEDLDELQMIIQIAQKQRRDK